MDLLQYDFMQRAFLSGIITSVIISVIGVFIVLRRMSLVGDSLSHSSLAGVAEHVVGIYPTALPLLFSVLAGLFIEVIRGAFKKYAEVALAVVMSGGMGLAVVLISIGKSFNADLFSYLFGSLMAVSDTDVKIISIAGFLIMLSIMFLYSQLFAITLDEEAALISGIPVKSINIFFTILTALTISLSIRVVGTLLVSALMVSCAVGLQTAKSFSQTAIAVGVSLFSTISGLYISFLLI